MRVLFMATGDISDFETVALVTQPDKPVGRKQVLTPPAIKQIALEHDIEVLQPERLRQTEAVDQLKALNADLFVVMAYGQILSTDVLSLPKVACINLHASLLPRHRGASCIQEAIVRGEQKTGITVMHMSEGLDEGDVILTKSIDIGSQETGGQLHDRLAELAPVVMLEAMGELAKNTAEREPQNDELSNYAPKLLRKHGEIDWSEAADTIERKIRAYEPWPGTFCVYLLVACGESSLLVQEIQPEGSKRMNVEDFLNSGTLQIGDQLS